MSVRGRNGSSAARSLPATLSSRRAGQSRGRRWACRAAGPRGSAAARPTTPTADAAGGETSCVGEADLVGELRRPRHPGEERVGALVDAGERRRTGVVRILPPSAVVGLEHRDARLRRARCSSACAAASPAIPPPTTTTWSSPAHLGGSLDVPARGSRAGERRHHGRVVVDARGAGEARGRAPRARAAASMSRSYSTSR